MSYIVQLNSPPASGQRKTLHSLTDTARFLQEQFQLEACYDAEGNFICFALPEWDSAAQTAEGLPEKFRLTANSGHQALRILRNGVPSNVITILRFDFKKY